MIEACIQSLELLIADGSFGTPSQRESMVIRFQVSDDDEVEGAMERLNMPNVAARYKAWLAEWT